MSLHRILICNKYIVKAFRDRRIPARLKPFVTQRQYKALIKIIEVYFKIHSPDKTFFLKDGHMLIISKKSLRQKELDAQKVVIDSIVHGVAEENRSAWHAHVHDFFESMKSNSRASKYLFTDYENAAPHLRVVIKSEQPEFDEVKGEMVCTQHFPGTQSLLALHYDGQFRLLLKDEITEWGLSEKELFEQALYNAAKDPCEWKKITTEDGLDCYMMYTPGFSAARLINIEQNDPHLIGDAGVFVAIPSNTMALAIPVNSREDGSLAFKEIMELAGAAYAEEASPIIFDVFYYTYKYDSMKDTILRLYSSFYEEIMGAVK